MMLEHESCSATTGAPTSGCRERLTGFALHDVSGMVQARARAIEAVMRESAPVWRHPRSADEIEDWTVLVAEGLRDLRLHPVRIKCEIRHAGERQSPTLDQPRARARPRVLLTLRRQLRTSCPAKTCAWMSSKALCVGSSACGSRTNPMIRRAVPRSLPLPWNRSGPTSPRLLGPSGSASHEQHRSQCVSRTQMRR